MHQSIWSLDLRFDFPEIIHSTVYVLELGFRKKKVINHYFLISWRWPSPRFEKDPGGSRHSAGTLHGRCWEQNDKSVLTIPWAMKIDNTLLFSWKIYFFNKRGGDNKYNDEIMRFVYLCVKKNHHFLKLCQSKVWDVFQDVWKTFSQTRLFKDEYE